MLHPPLFRVFITLYRGVGVLLQPFVWLFLRWRCHNHKEIKSRLQERFGHPTQSRPWDGRASSLIWLHGASVGESLSTLPLIDAIRAKHPKATILMTSGTVTSANLLEKRLPKGVIHQFLPLDIAPCVRRFLDHWRPDLVLWFESELWPMQLSSIHNRCIPAVLVNARFSDKTFATWQRFRWLAQGIFATFDLCLASSVDVERKLTKLGAQNVHLTGNLKYAGRPLPVEEASLAQLKTLLEKKRPTWVAASTHPGEELLMADVHQHLKKTLPDVLTVIIPRHPERGTTVAEQLGEKGLNVIRRSQGKIPGPTTDIYLVDTLGELGLFFHQIPIVVIGGSFTPVGGHNPLEPAYFSTAIAWGPHMFNFAEIEGAFLEKNAAVKVKDMPHLATTLLTWLTNTDQAVQQGRRAKDALRGNDAILAKTVALLTPYLEQATGNDKGFSGKEAISSPENTQDGR